MSRSEFVAAQEIGDETVDIGSLLMTMERVGSFPYADASKAYPEAATSQPDVFACHEVRINPQNPSLYVLLGPSGAGADTLLDAVADMKYPFVRILTATTRSRRVGEDEQAYVWMEDTLRGSDAEIIGRLAVNYGLLECQNYGGSFYGTPFASVEAAAHDTPELPIILKNECEGVAKIKRQVEDKLNVVTLGLVPESYQQLWNRMTDRNNRLERMVESFKYAVEVQRVANFIIRNRETPGTPAKGIRSTAEQLIALIKSIQAQREIA